MFTVNSQSNMYVVHEYNKFFEILVKINIYKQSHVHGLHTSKKKIYKRDNSKMKYLKKSTLFLWINLEIIL